VRFEDDTGRCTWCASRCARAWHTWDAMAALYQCRACGSSCPPLIAFPDLGGGPEPVRGEPAPLGWAALRSVYPPSAGATPAGACNIAPP